MSDDHARLFFVRHGESGWNVDGLVQGQSREAPGLTARGRSHATAVATALAGCHIRRVVSSDLLRAIETAAPIAHAIDAPMRVDPRLRERELGEAEGRHQENVADALGVIDGVVSDPDAAPIGGESIRALYRRIAALIDEVITSTTSGGIALVSHGGPLRVARAYLAGVPVEAMSWPAIANGSILEIGMEGTRPVERKFYDPAQQTMT